MKTIDYENKIKQCRKCNEMKPFNDFYKSGMALHSWCKECAKKYRKQKKQVLEQITEDYDNDDYELFKEWDLEQAYKEIQRLKEEIKSLYKYTSEKGFRLVGDEDNER